MEILAESLASQVTPASGERLSAAHPAGIWFAEECRELILLSERYDFTISLLLFSGTLPGWEEQQANRAWGLGRPMLDGGDEEL